MNNTSIEDAIIALVIMYRMGATANSNESVAIVGTTINVSDQICSTAPSPTVSPPKQPTINRTTHINPNRLNSTFANIPSVFFKSPITLTFMIDYKD